MRKTVTWRPVSYERAHQMLNILPPACQTGLGFLVGEPVSYRTCAVTGRNGTPTFDAFAETDGLGAYEASEPLTVAEFKAMRLHDVLDHRAREIA